MGFLSKIFGKKFDALQKKTELFTKINNMINNNISNDTICDKLYELKNFINNDRNFTEDKYRTYTLELDNLDMSIINQPKVVASKNVTRTVDMLQGKGKKMTDREKQVDKNDTEISVNQEKIDKLYNEIRIKENKLDILENRLDNIEDEDSAIYQKLDNEYEVLSMELDGLQSEYSRCMETIQSSVNMNVQTKQAELIGKQYVHAQQVSQQLQNLDTAKLEAMREESEQVLDEQMESAKNISNLAKFNTRRFSHSRRDKNKAANKTQKEIEESLGGMTIDEAISNIDVNKD